jgi:hypothetical protein
MAWPPLVCCQRTMPETPSMSEMMWTLTAARS